MPSRTAVVASAAGLHARPATLFVEAARNQPVKVTIAHGDRPAVDAASILAVLSLGVGQGDAVTLQAEGEGADEALATLAAILETDADNPS
ncbi:HPr family phosphocarrier protein [Streptomyces sp. DSM 44915]|uniref:Phosphocarrier protein HPr n=1 Tax=Streptomyces chisholmiae TaxID=3075540 RepID=A0ABU2JYN3_9ACTN|nr:HPr family phosphocarrier protein [Streptomyces sp. DSM 44915]MDT0269629.1 HPr family phosphocarrier protein [Streptomyces sp. DSM 44915]